MQKRDTTISLFISKEKWHQEIQLQSVHKITHQRGYSFLSFGKKPIKSAEELSDKLEYDTRLVRKRYGYYYLCIPKRLDKYNGLSQTKVIAVDPGERSFFTGYDPDGVIVEVGKSDISRIEKTFLSL